MALIIKVVNYKGSPPAQAISAQFDEQGGSIGRSPDNHLVLPDPEKFISRLHARIIFQGGQYFIQDSSTGGTYVGPNEQFLHQSQVALVNGERLRIGEYELLASFAENLQADFVPIFEPVRELDMAESGLLEHPFTEPKKPVSTDFFSSFVDQPESSVFHESFTPPQVAETPQIPANDDLDFGDLLSSLESLPGAGVAPKPEFPTLPDDFFADESIAPEIPAQPEISPNLDVFPVDSQIPPAEKPIFPAEEAPSAFQIPRPAAGPAKTVTAEERVAAAIEPIDHDVSPEQPTLGVADSELIRQFLAGAGITDASILPAEQWPALMKTSGELLRSMMEGLMMVLRARAELKSQFRVSVTTMRSIDNNPLKFTPNVDDAVKLMLAPTHPGFLGPKEAVKEGFGDIMNHQMAMTAGIQAALSDVLRRFDPELIEKSQTEGVLFQKKAKCWEHYTETYPQLKAAAQEEFFGEAFADAYEKQMLLLSRSAKSQ